MSEHALIVEQRQEIIEDLEDRLESIRHTFDITTSQRRARELLKNPEKYSYVILSLDIPVKPERPSKMKFGFNLFKEMQCIFSNRSIPIVVTLERRHINSNTAIKMVHRGAFIAVKPFEDNVEFSLENAIFAALDSKSNPDNIVDVALEASPDQIDTKIVSENKDGDLTKPEMIFYNNRVELCGVTVCGGSGTLTRRLLDLFKERGTEGKYRAYSGYELAIIADCESGQPGISACINNFKRKVNTYVANAKPQVIHG